MAIDFDPTSAKPAGSPAFEFDAASAKPAPTRSLARSAGDTAIALGTGVTQGVKMLTDVAGADNTVSRGLESATKAMSGLESPYRQQQRQERAAKIKEAEASGSTWEEVKAHVGAFADAPLDTTVNALGTSVPTLAAAAIPGLGQSALAMRAAQVGVGAAQGVGNIKGQIHETVKQKHLDAGATEADAQRRADAAQAYGGDNLGQIALGGVLGAAAGGTGAEAALGRVLGRKAAGEVVERAAPGVLRSAAAGVAKEAPMEAAQGGQERLASNLALQGEGFDVPTWQGVAGQAALEGLAAAPMGGGFGVAEGVHARAAQQAQAQALQADPTSAWTTAPGAADPSAQTQPGAGPAVAPDAPDLGTTPGAAAQREGGIDFTREVDTAGLSLQDPAEVERARAATVDYQPGDATPQWDTAPGAAPARQGLDMPTPEFDTGDLGIDTRTPSERMGINPAAGPLSKAAATALDSGAAQEATFLGRTGRDLQPRQTGPGLGNDANVIDVQGRVVEDRAIGTPRRLTTEQGGAVDGAGSRAALPPPSKLRLYLDRARSASENSQADQAVSTSQQAPAAINNVADQPAITTQGAPANGPQADQTQQASPQPAQAAAPTPAAGLTDAAPSENLGTQGAPEAAAQGAAPAEVGPRPKNWRTSMLGAVPVAKGLGIETKGKRLAQVVAEIDAQDAQQVASAQQQRDDFRAAEAKRSAPGNRARAAAGDANPFKAFIAKHGISIDQRREFAPGATEQRQAMVPGYGPIFRKTGKPLDKLAQAAVDEGFLTSPDEAALYDLVGRALRGERIAAQYTADAAETEMQSRIARQREMEEDAASAVADLSDPALFDLNDDDIVLTANSNTSTADFLRALGATDEEIQDAIANEQAGATAGDQGRTRPQETDTGTAQGLAGQGTPQAQPERVTTGDLLGKSPNQSQQAAADVQALRQRQEAAQRNAAPAPEEFALSMMDANTGREVAPGQGSIFEAQQVSPPRSTPRQESDANAYAGIEGKAPVAINSGANSPESGPRPARAAPPRPTTKIEDFGETLHGARKMLYTEAYADGMAKAKELDTKAHPLSKTWPEPDYQKLLEGGAPLPAVSMVRALRDAVPTKPQSSWKLKGWSAQVETLRSFAEDALAGRKELAAMRSELNRDGMPQGIADKAALYEAMGHELSLKGIKLSAGHYSMYDRVTYNPPRTIWSVSREAKGSTFGNWPRELAKGDTREEAIAAFKQRATELLAEEQAPTKGATFEIYSKRAGGAREFYVGKKIGRNVAELKTGFPDLKAARAYKADNQTELENLLAQYKAVPSVRNTQNAPRIGEDYRKGADVTPEQFQDAFGFRGVQFGNYVEGGRRQQDLNRAYDALMDLAGVLGLPPRALSLGGRLGLAFGARGSGGQNAFAAHYEPTTVVINLTKREGAGTLAHEWWHGLDNYFSRQRGEGDNYMTADSWRGDGVREEMRSAFRAVMSAINLTGMQERSRKLDDRRTKEYWTTKPEMSARAFESYVIAKLQDQNAGNDYLANVVGASVFALEGGYPYPTAGEMPQIREAFDAFFQAVETRQEEGGATVLYNTSDSAPPERGLSLEQAQQAVQKALAGLRNPPPIDIVARSQELGVGTPDGVMGAAIPGEGRIVIVASAHRSADAVVETLFHEMFHLGVRNVLPAQDYAQAMLDLAKRDVRVQEYANRWKSEASDAPQQLQALRELGLKGIELTASYEALAIEEGLAVVAEELQAQKQAGTRLGLRVRSLANWLASVADRMGMQGLAERIRKMTYNEAERFVLKAIEHAGRSAGARGGVRYRAVAQAQSPAFERWFQNSQVVDAQGAPLRVFHGTGGDFSVFSRDRAGAATGAANTGMGFFFTDNAEVAGNYARMSRESQSIMPTYLSLQNPLRLDAKNMMEADKLLLSGLRAENDGAIIRVAMRDGGTQTVYMVREPGQIKSATGNRGTFDPSNADIRYRARDENPTAQRMGDALKSVTVANLKQQAGFKAADYRGIGLQFLGRRQLVDVYSGMLPELRSYSDLMARMDADKNEAGSGADQLAQDWAKLPDERALAELMHDATLAQIDPTKEFVEGDNKTDWNRLKARYTALTPGAKDVFARARDTYRQHMHDVRSAIKERIERTEMSSERRAALIKRMDDEFFGHIKGVYFPLARFGQYVVVVKGADGKVENVSRAETMAEADAARRQLVTAFPTAKGFTVGKVLKAKDFVAERDSVGRGFMEQLYGVLDKQGMDTKQRAELEDALGQLYLSSLPDLSWAKHGIHRKGTPGFSQDARRAFAQNVFHGASYLAKLRYSDRLQDELGEMQRRVDGRASDADFDSVKAQQVVDEMVKRHDAAMNPKTNAVSTALTSLGFMFHLGLSPASAMVNLTQTALVAYPVMGAKWGFGKASAALLKASGEAVRGKNDITSSLSADEKSAFDEAARSGVIDVTMAHDLAGIAQGEDQNVSWKLRPAMRAASFLFHHAEKFNRQVTFVAAYRLAREAGADTTAAYEQAAQATYDGHFDYSANNRPRVMQGNVARVLLLFKQYGQNMVYTLARSAQQSLKGATPEARAEARKALGGLLTMHAMAAGALGLPMVTTLLAAASMLGGDDDEPWDAKVALQNMLADALGQKPAEVLAHGLSRLTPFDISGRVGLDKLIFPDVQEGLEGQRLAESAMTAALGPVAGIGVNVLKGMQEMSEGRYARGLETMAPAVLRGPVKAIRYGDEGVKDKTGIVVQDEVSAAELLGQAAGFSPSSVRNSFEGKSAIVQHDRALQARRSALVEQFAMAAMAGDEGGKAEAREDIAKFNEKNPNRRIQPMQLAQSVNQRQKRIREAQEGVYLPSKRRDALEAGRFAVPD